MTESTMPPVAVKIEINGDEADVILTENAAQIDREGQGIYQYDEYRITVPNRPALEQAVNAGFAEWLAHAKTICNAPPPLTLPQKVDSIETTQDIIVEVLARGLGVAL